jgi:hypothetical protein
MSQTDRILAHLEAGNTITPAEAYAMVGSLALHSRIAEIRERGFVVQKVMHHDHGRTWGEYWLAVAHG